jgi:hypothetical protein
MSNSPLSPNSVEDVAEAAVVRALLERGVGHAQVRRAIERLRAYGDWPLSDAPLATTTRPTCSRRAAGS